MSIIQLVENIQTNWKDILLEQRNELEKISGVHTQQKTMYEPDLQILPSDEKIFNAFNYFNIEETKVLLLGQDPYINIGEAQGLCFSVPNGIKKVPPSLVNIFKELETEYGKLRKETDLTDWSQQGILLLNSALTVLQGKSNFNAKIWVNFTDKIIQEVSNRCNGVVFVLWGNNAIMKEKLVDLSKHKILKSVHPSPLSASRGFFGNNHFKEINDYLKKNGKKEIKWL